MRCGQTSHERLGKAEHFVGVGAHTKGDKDVHAAASGSLNVRSKLDGFERFAHILRCASGVGKFAGLWIEVEAKPIGLARSRSPAAGNMHSDTSEVGERQLRFERP